LKKVTIATLVAASLFILSQPSFAKENYPDMGAIKVDGDFQDYIVPWTNGGKYMGKIALVNTDQGLALCGAGYLKGASKQFNDQLLAVTYLENNGKIILENFRFFSHYRSKKHFKGATAKCRLTKLRRKLKESDDISIGQRKTRFRD
jgi:hypothetical protein